MTNLFRIIGYFVITGIIFIFPLRLLSQNIVYKTLYTDATFVKNTNTGLPVGLTEGQYATTNLGVASLQSL